MSENKLGNQTVWLSLAYLLYFAQMGALVPYLAIYLDQKGLSSAEIGQLISLITFARILGPNLWANIADRTGKTLLILKIGIGLSLLGFSLLIFGQSFWVLVGCFGLVTMFWTAIMPQMEVITLNSVKGDAGRYSKIRSWGSFGFILLTTLTGLLFDWFSADVLIVVCLVVMSGLLLTSLQLQQPVIKQDEQQQPGSILNLVMAPVFIGFILSMCLLQVSFGAYNSFFTLYMQDLGYSGLDAGLFISLGVLAEIGIFMIAGRIIGRFGVKWILTSCFALTALRWWVLANFADVLWILILSQILHALSFGLTHAAAMHFIHQHFGKGFQSRGQALYISISMGMGGAIGNLLAGHLWQQGAGSTQTFMASAAMVAGAAVVTLFMPKRWFKT